MIDDLSTAAAANLASLSGIFTYIKLQVLG
jgi:hypothetical protein